MNITIRKKKESGLLKDKLFSMKIKKGFMLLLAGVLFTSCSKTKVVNTEINNLAEQPKIETAITDPEILEKDDAYYLRQYVQNMPLEEKISQLFIVNLEGNKNFTPWETYEYITDSENKKFLIPGGYLFFSYNLSDSYEQTKGFIQSIKKYCTDNNYITPFLAIDQEGGLVNRLRTLTGGLPSQEKIAKNYTLEQAFDLYSDQAIKMEDLGFDMNLAPVVEVCTEKNKVFLSGRSFGGPVETKNYSKTAVKAYENNGIGAVIKHFPGNTNTDPHTGLPVIKDEYKDLMISLLPFKSVLKNQPAGVLMSHAITTSVDNGVPACLSSIWVTDILRNNFGYKGIIFSDDIFMSALADNGFPPETAALKAIEAGIDCIMISEKRFSKPAKVIYEKALTDSDFENRINESVTRIMEYKIKKGIFNINETE